MLDDIKTKELEKRISKFSDGKANRICIFCAGVYGLRLHQELLSRLIYVHCFSDNDSSKWGYIERGIYCIPPAELEKERSCTLVIVATKNPDSIIADLKNKSYPYVIQHQDIMNIIEGFPRSNWMSALYGMNGIDYTSKDVQTLIDSFNQNIFDICKFYEDRKT